MITTYPYSNYSPIPNPTLPIRYLKDTPGVEQYLISGSPAVLFEEFVLALGDIGFSDEV